MAAEEENKILRDRIEQLTQERNQLAQEKTQLAEENTQLAKQLTPLTFTNLLTLCHEEIAEVQAEQDLSKCTTGRVGEARDKLVPLALRVWTDFQNLQTSTFRKVSAIYDKCKEPPATFPNSNIIIQGIKPKRKPLASELDLRKQQADCVEDMIEVIIKDLIKERELPNEWQLGSDIYIDNHANKLTENNEKVLVAKVADKIFIRKAEGDAKRLVLVIEYKPPHKLSIAMLQAGLKDLDPLDLIHRVKSSNDKAINYIENSEAAVAVVVAQVYTYMIDSGLQYAYFTTGEAFVFLYTQEQDRNTLYYHVVIHKNASTAGTVDWISDTAIGQVLSFYILACEGKLYDQDSRIRHRKDAYEWLKDENRLLANMTPTPSPQKPPKESPGYGSNTKRHAAAHSQSRTGRRLRSSTTGETPALDIQAKKDDSDDPTDGGDRGAPSDPFVSASTRASKRSKDTSSQSTNKANQTHNEPSSSSGKRHESYCSHQCLLGLTTNGALDSSCPNYGFHPKTRKGRGKERHAISVVQLRKLLLAQIQETMNTNIEPLGIEGSRGAIFKLTLASHGYTMIGKGTPPHYVADLRREKTVYDRLRKIQGTFIPVCLGAIDSPRRYFYDVDVAIFHWLLMSFAGTPLSDADFEASRSSVDAMQEKLMQHGIIHTDLSPNNILWDERAKKLMVIDFECSSLVVKEEKAKEIKDEQKQKSEQKQQQDTHFLKEMSPNKTTLRKRKDMERGENVAGRPAKVRIQ